MTELAGIASLLKEKDSFLLLTHKRPDGDTLGSAAALCHALRRIGKAAFLYNNPQVTESYAALAAPYLAPPEFSPSFVIAVDTADENMLPAGFHGSVDLSLDHHMSSTLFGRLNLVWQDKAACGELILELIVALCGDCDAAEAELLYIAISTDTGCFLYANTTAETLRAAARLLDMGVNNGRLNKRLFRTLSRPRLMLEGMIYSSLRSERDGAINIAVITLDMMERAGATEDDCEDLAAVAGRVAGNRTAVTVRELEGGSCKISVRTDGTVNASEVCQKFGGGGHSMAAGCELHCSPMEAADKILEAINEVFV
jgi:phosphoesterase RecJ-like protein